MSRTLISVQDAFFAYIDNKTIIPRDDIVSLLSKVAEFCHLILLPDRLR